MVNLLGNSLVLNIHLHNLGPVQIKVLINSVVCCLRVKVLSSFLTPFTTKCVCENVLLIRFLFLISMAEQTALWRDDGRHCLPSVVLTLRLISLFRLSETNEDRNQFVGMIKTIFQRPEAWTCQQRLSHHWPLLPFFCLFDFYDGVLTWMIKGKN